MFNSYKEERIKGFMVTGRIAGDYDKEIKGNLVVMGSPYSGNVYFHYNDGLLYLSLDGLDDINVNRIELKKLYLYGGINKTTKDTTTDEIRELADKFALHILSEIKNNSNDLLLKLKTNGGLK